MFPEKYFLISDFQSMELLGVKGLFTNLRVERSSLPEGFFKYSLREGEDDFLSSVKSDVLVNHMGDFICKQELDLNGQDEYDLLGDYSFTDDPVDLDAFFGEDIKLKIAQELDSFYYDFDTHEYNDCVPSGWTREDMVQGIYNELSEKKYVEGVKNYLTTLLENNREEHFLSDRDEQKVRCFLGTLAVLNSRNRDGLDTIVAKANAVKDEQAKAEQSMMPEIQ